MSSWNAIAPTSGACSLRFRIKRPRPAQKRGPASGNPWPTPVEDFRDFIVAPRHVFGDSAWYQIRNNSARRGASSSQIFSSPSRLIFECAPFTSTLATTQVGLRNVTFSSIENARTAPSGVLNPYWRGPAAASDSGANTSMRAPTATFLMNDGTSMGRTRPSGRGPARRSLCISMSLVSWLIFPTATRSNKSITSSVTSSLSSRTSTFHMLAAEPRRPELAAPSAWRIRERILSLRSLCSCSFSSMWPLLLEQRASVLGSSFCSLSQAAGLRSGAAVDFRAEIAFRHDSCLARLSMRSANFLSDWPLFESTGFMLPSSSSASISNHSPSLMAWNRERGLLFRDSPASPPLWKSSLSTSNSLLQACRPATLSSSSDRASLIKAAFTSR